MTKYTNPSHQKKSRRGTARCDFCDKSIKVGETYWKFEVKFRAIQRRCEEHPFRMSDKAQGRNAEVYAVQEYLEDWINGKDQTEISELLEGAKTDLENTADEYENGIPETISTFIQDETQEKVDMIRSGMDKIDELLPVVKTKSRDDQETEVQEIIDELAI